MIDGRADRSIILTCAHLFRPAKGAYTTPEKYRGKIRLELFALKGSKVELLESLPATLIDYSVSRDVGLIECKPGRQLRASPLADASYRAARGEGLASVGCSSGEDPTLWAHRVRGEIKEAGENVAYSAIVVEPKPVGGRSGGGLFTLNGRLVGVCNFAEIASNGGYYASPRSVAWIVEKNGIDPLAHPSDPGELEVIPGQSGTRPHPRAPDASPSPSPQASAPPLVAFPNQGPVVSWIERTMGITPGHLTFGAVIFAAWQWWASRKRKLEAPSMRATAQKPSPDARPAPPASAADKFSAAFDLFTDAVRLDQAEQSRRNHDAKQAELRQSILDQVKAAITPTSGPTASSPLPAS